MEKYHKDVYADILFFHDYGGRLMFQGNLASHIVIIDSPEKIRQFIQIGNYDFIISIDTPEIYEMTRGMNLRMILEVHTHYNNNRLYLKSILISEQPTIAITVPTDYFKGIVEKEIRGRVPVYTFPNFIGPGYNCEFDSYEFFRADSCRKEIGWVGRLDSLKNWSEFLIIAKAVLDCRNDVGFVIVGGSAADESGRKAFQKNLEEKGLLPYIKWLPFYTHMPLFYKYLAATGGCFVSTSTAESFGMTVLESMYCKCPVLCTNIGAFSEVLFSGTYGMQYNLGDTSDAVRKINQILDDNEYRRRIIPLAREHVEKKYDPENILSEWINFLNKLL